MRAALREAHHWVRHRAAFQRRLIDQPLMRAVLADAVLAPRLPKTRQLELFDA